jgi:hypothetical protein
MSEKKMMTIIIAVALGSSFFFILGIPIIFSAATGVPLWFLFPFHTFSIGPSQAPMTVNVNSTAPTTVGQSVLISVLDGINHTSIEGASVKIVFNGYDYYNTTTGSEGTAQFSYPGATTIIYVSKDGYQDAEPIPLPQIPDNWVTIRDYQIITWGLSLFGSWGSALFLYRKQQAKLPSRRKRK